MKIDIKDCKGRFYGRLQIDEENEMEIIDCTDDLTYDYDYRYPDEYEREIEIELRKSTAFSSQNLITATGDKKKLEQELATYKAIKKAYEEKDYRECNTLIAYYLGHIDYGEAFGYYKTHDEICLILYTNLLYSLTDYATKDTFIDFVDRMITKFKVWCDVE